MVMTTSGSNKVNSDELTDPVMTAFAPPPPSLDAAGRKAFYNVTGRLRDILLAAGSGPAGTTEHAA